MEEHQSSGGAGGGISPSHNRSDEGIHQQSQSQQQIRLPPLSYINGAGMVALDRHATHMEVVRHVEGHVSPRTAHALHQESHIALHQSVVKSEDVNEQQQQQQQQQQYHQQQRLHWGHGDAAAQHHSESSSTAESHSPSVGQQQHHHDNHAAAMAAAAAAEPHCLAAHLHHHQSGGLNHHAAAAAAVVAAACNADDIGAQGGGAGGGAGGPPPPRHSQALHSFAHDISAAAAAAANHHVSPSGDTGRGYDPISVAAAMQDPAAAAAAAQEFYLSVTADEAQRQRTAASSVQTSVGNLYRQHAAAHAAAIQHAAACGHVSDHMLTAGEASSCLSAANDPMAFHNTNLVAASGGGNSVCDGVRGFDSDGVLTQKAVAFMPGPRERIHVFGNPVEACPRCQAEGIPNIAWRPHRHIGELKIRYICERHFGDLDSVHHFDIPLCPICGQVLYLYEFNGMLGVGSARRLHKYVLKCSTRHVLPLLDLFCQTKKGGERCNSNFKLQWSYGTMVKRCETQKNRDHDLWWVRYKNEWKQRRTIIRYKKDFLRHLADVQRAVLLGLGSEGEPPPDPKAVLGPSTYDALVSGCGGGAPQPSSPKIKKRRGEHLQLSSAGGSDELQCLDFHLSDVSVAKRFRPSVCEEVDVAAAVAMSAAASHRYSLADPHSLSAHSSGLSANGLSAAAFQMMRQIQQPSLNPYGGVDGTHATHTSEIAKCNPQMHAVGLDSTPPPHSQRQQLLQLGDETNPPSVASITPIKTYHADDL